MCYSYIKDGEVMNKIKKLFLCLILGIIFTTGCSLIKTAITDEDFSSTMSQYNYTIQDVSQQFANYDYVKKATIALSENQTYQIEFYVLDTESNAKKMFKNNQKIFEDKTKNGLTKTVDMKNYNTYSIYNKTEYRYLCRVDNTLIYIDTKVEYKDDVEKIIKKLGY